MPNSSLLVRARALAPRLFTHGTIILLIAAVAACGRDEGDCEECGVINPPDTDNPGTMQGFVTDEPESSSAASPSGAATYSGTINGRSDIEVSANQQTWYTLGNARDFETDLQSGSTAEMTTSGQLPAGTYRYVRINFENVEATVDAGSVVEGETLPADIDLRLGDTRNAIVSADVGSFELETDGSAEIVLDLNSEVWMTVETLSNREIKKATFEDAATVTVVPGS